VCAICLFTVVVYPGPLERILELDPPAESITSSSSGITAAAAATSEGAAVSAALCRDVCGRLPLHLAAQGGHLASAAALATALTAAKVRACVNTVRPAVRLMQLSQVSLRMLKSAFAPVERCCWRGSDSVLASS
jgi:hypothetical protein